MKNTLLLSNQKDQYLDVNYDLFSFNAKELSNYLNDNTKEDLDSFNKKDGNTPVNSLIELYEYQPFFLYKDNDGVFKLLDGFRRLLWYDVPENIDIKVRVYKDLSNKQLLELMINLNHFKFFSSTQNYYDRGFSLFMKTFFDLNINKNNKLFDYYLSSVKSKAGFSESKDNVKNQDKNELVKDRILNDYFIDDVKFLFKLKDEGYCSNDQLCTTIHNLREEIGEDFKLDYELFLEKLKASKKQVELSIKLKNSFIGSSYTNSDATNLNILSEFYTKIIKEINGFQVDLTFQEKNEVIKQELAKLKKDKSLTKLSGKQSLRKDIEDIVKASQNGSKIEFICLIYPDDSSVSRWSSNNYNKKNYIEYGVYNNLKLTKITTRTHLMSSWYVLDIEDKVENIKIKDCRLSDSKYNTVEFCDSTLGWLSQKCELFYKIIE